MMRIVGVGYTNSKWWLKGLTNLDDVQALCAVEAEGIMGAITGRAIYQGTLDFAAAQKLADELGDSGMDLINYEI